MPRSRRPRQEGKRKEWVIVVRRSEMDDGGANTGCLSNGFVTILEGEFRTGFYDQVWRDQLKGDPEGATGPEGCP